MPIIPWRAPRRRRKYWLLPAILMVLFGGLFVLAKSAPGLPFLYAY